MIQRRGPDDQAEHLKSPESSARATPMRTFQGFCGTLDGTLGDALAFCWGTIRQVERYANVPTLSTPRGFGLHHVEEHLLFTAANDALSHLDSVERLLEEVKSFCQQDVTPHLDALSNACPTSFRDRLRETRNLLAGTSRRTGPMSKV